MRIKKVYKLKVTKCLCIDNTALSHCIYESNYARNSGFQKDRRFTLVLYKFRPKQMKLNFIAFLINVRKAFQLPLSATGYPLAWMQKNQSHYYRLEFFPEICYLTLLVNEETLDHYT